MTICDKIQTIGNTLQDNLNNRGISCTFGSGTNESTILDMVEMVNDTNFSGSNDVNLSITANRPYLLENETTDIIVHLEDGMQQPLKNKNVIVGNTIKRDNGTTSNYNDDDWIKYNPNNFTVTRGEEYTSVTGSNYRYGMPISKSCKISMEVSKSANSGNLLSIWTHQGTPTSASQLLTFNFSELGLTVDTFAKVEMIITPTSVTVTNLDNNTTVTKTYSTTYKLMFNFCGTTFKYKNFLISDGNFGVTDENGNFTLYNVNVPTDTTFYVTYKNETASVNILLCEVVDYGVKNNNNSTHWYYNSNYGNIDVTDDRTICTAKSTTNYLTHSALTTEPYSNVNIYIYNFPFTVDFDLLSYEDTSNSAKSRTRIYNNTNNRVCYWNFLNNGKGHYKFVCLPNSQKLYFNGVEQSRKFTFANANYDVSFQTFAKVEFRNFAINDLLLFNDNAITGDYNEKWYRNSYGSFTIQSNGTKILNTSGNSNFYMVSSIPYNLTVSDANTYKYNEPLIIEFDIVELSQSTNSDIQFQVYSNETLDNFTQALTETGHYKVELKDGCQKIYKDGTLIIVKYYSLPNSRITLRVRNNHYLVYKNFMIYKNPLVGD